MMEIVNNQHVPVEVKEIALKMLHRSVKQQWKHQMQVEEKNKIKATLVKAFSQCPNTYKLTKKYQEVVTLVFGYEYKSWSPLEEVLHLLSEGNNIGNLLKFLIAMASHF